MPRICLLALVTLLSLSATPPAVRADSGRLHLHLDLGLGAAVVGPTSRRGDQTDGRPFGGGGWLTADYQLAPPFSIEVIFGLAFFGRPFAGTGDAEARLGQAGIGARFRFLDDQTGYATEPEGNLPSNLWVSSHINFINYDSAQFGIDAAVGYEFSVVRPLQLGLFSRAILSFGGRESGVDMAIVGGISIGIELVGVRRARDSDGDGVSDEREAEIGTDPHDDDTDGDLLSDFLEDETGTNPLERDTDNDGLNDGREDENQNGILDPGESDPRRADTDGGGMGDAEEAHQPGQDPQFADDDDRDNDGVINSFDECPGSPEGGSVNAIGCPVAAPEPQTLTEPETLTLEGVRFASGRATILPESEATLMEALEALRQTETRYEVAGHTDSQGAENANQRLSQRRAEAVRQWLVGHGLDASRFEARGYGESAPVADNATPEGRARNRRIEFRPLSE